MDVLNHKIPHQRFFEEMTRIPHGSFNEKAYSDYLARFAKERSLRCVQDAYGNVVIYKPASPGYESHPTVILQAHMDMVCEKVGDCAHDFEKEPLDIYIDGGFLRARGTTLGADDGIGVAYILAALDSSDMKHPALECVITVQEEVGMYGAIGLDKSLLTGRRFLGLDDVDGDSTTITSAGGMSMALKKKVERTAQAPNEVLYKLTVSGLRGGHSGVCIGMELGNAVKLTARLLHELDRRHSIRLKSISGGEKDNAIPREAEAAFVSAAPEKDLEETAAALAALLKKEFAVADGDLSISLTRAATESGELCPLAQEDSRSVIRMMYLLPTGVRRRSVQIEGLVEASENMASVRTEAEFIELRCSLRSAVDSCLAQMEEELRLTAEIFGAEFLPTPRYPAWPYNPDSFMRDKLAEAFREKTGNELILKAAHGGLECGVFASIDEKMDIATFGAKGIDVHTPNEHLDLKSFDECFEIFRCFLEKL